MPRGIIQKPRMGRKPKIPPIISSMPETVRSQRGYRITLWRIRVARLSLRSVVSLTAKPWTKMKSRATCNLDKHGDANCHMRYVGTASELIVGFTEGFGKCGFVVIGKG